MPLREVTWDMGEDESFRASDGNDLMVGIQRGSITDAQSLLVRRQFVDTIQSMIEHAHSGNLSTMRKDRYDRHKETLRNRAPEITMPTSGTRALVMDIPQAILDIIEDLRPAGSRQALVLLPVAGAISTEDNEQTVNVDGVVGLGTSDLTQNSDAAVVAETDKTITTDAAVSVDDRERTLSCILAVKVEDSEVTQSADGVVGLGAFDATINNDGVVATRVFLTCWTDGAVQVETDATLTASGRVEI